MSSRQRLPSGRSNTTTTTLPSSRQPPLRLTVIPEENNQSTGRLNTGRVLNEERFPTGRQHQPQLSSRLSSREETGRIYSSRPWAAPSVQDLTQQLGKNKEAHALVVEGPTGDVLTAVGTDKDNSIANRILSDTQRSKKEQNNEDMNRTLNAGHTPRFVSHHPSKHKTKATPREFGVVYEHKDCFGKPKFIGHTGKVPEKQFSEDASQHQAVRNLLTYEQGKSEVVWAGTGALSRAGGGADTMENITKRIVDERAKELELNKLRGPKPYSRHGY